ncbi:L-threonine dehydratase catabolic TdcB-like isoform X1 [Ahaetulla prasina]|uniref:L-threonine dehydratase catabolic TdcB-like isoform X1 n=1 Tax=Ahaetulla prasina TaxID=499056 RepID=UPI00264826C0|nr:L-threonine dehydratase catabolic TdcB-like isoform X1 [Ahaetulla prasina]
MDSPTFAPAARSVALASRGPHLPSYSAVVRTLVRFFVFFVVLLYSSGKMLFAKKSGESKPKKLAASASSELHLHKDRQKRNSRAEQRRSSIHPERLKGFGEEEELNGGVKTWEMKIISQEEEKLNDSATCPEVAISKPIYTTCKKIQEISAAALKIQHGVLKTPCTYSRLSKQYGMEIYLKKELLQYTGTAKERGVLYLLMSLREDQQRNGVIVASDCNFSMAVAYHASELHIPVFVIMSACTLPTRVKMCREYGAMVISYGSTVKDSHLHARRLAQENNYLYLEEDDSAIYLSGLGTMGLEIYEQVPKLDAVILPAGIPSGLLASNSAVLKHLNPQVFVVGVELENIPVDQQSLKMGQPVEDHTYSHPQFYRELNGFGTNSFQLTGNWVDKVVTVREEDVLISMLRLLEYEHVAVDAEGALALAALVAGKLPELKGKRVAVAVSSGNMELPLMRQCMDQALTLDNRVCKFTVTTVDCPGEISKLLETLAREEARILNIRQEQPYMRSDLFTNEVSCVIETRDRSHTTQLRKILTERYPMITWVER